MRCFAGDGRIPIRTGLDMTVKGTTIWLRRQWPWLLVSAAIIYQAVLLTTGTIIPIAKPIWRLRSLSATERSAIIGFSRDFSNYIDFVKQHVPEDATVAIPKPPQGQEFGYVAIMQYFLFPRTIIDCPPETAVECVLKMTGPDSYILAPNAVFPPREAADRVRRFISYDGVRGVYAP